MSSVWYGKLYPLWRVHVTYIDWLKRCSNIYGESRSWCSWQESIAKESEKSLLLAKAKEGDLGMETQMSLEEFLRKTGWYAWTRAVPFDLAVLRLGVVFSSHTHTQTHTQYVPLCSITPCYIVPSMAQVEQNQLCISEWTSSYKYASQFHVAGTDSHSLFGITTWYMQGRRQ